MRGDLNEYAEPERLIGQSWNANAAAWTRTVRGGRIESRRVATDAAILRAVLERAPRSVLDVGCGEGWLCRALAERGIEVVGVDGSEPLIEAARAQGGARFEVLSYEQIGAKTSPLRGERFDVIVCNFALLHADLAAVLRGLGELLHPGGALVIQTVHPWSARGEHAYADGWRTETFASFGGEFPEPMPWYFRTLSSWVKVLRDGRFRVADVREPVHPETGIPLSLLMIAHPA